MAKRVSAWPAFLVRLNPTTLDRLRKDAEIRALPVSAIVRETLDARFREETRADLSR
jgi:hypothetical protein